MKLSISILLISVTSVLSSAENPTRTELLQTVQHIERLSSQLQKDLDSEKNAHKQVEDALILGTKQNVTLQNQVNQVTDKLNSVQDQLDKAKKSLSWYRWHWWGSWVIFGLGIVACAIFAFLKFTGRLAIVGAAVAAKVP